MELAVHMKNIETGEKRIKKVIGKDSALENWDCKDFHSGSVWKWVATEPFKNVKEKVKHIGGGYYVKCEEAE